MSECVSNVVSEATVESVLDVRARRLFPCGFELCDKHPVKG